MVARSNEMARFEAGADEESGMGRHDCVDVGLGEDLFPVSIVPTKALTGPVVPLTQRDLSELSDLLGESTKPAALGEIDADEILRLERNGRLVIGFGDGTASGGTRKRVPIPSWLDSTPVAHIIPS